MQFSTSFFPGNLLQGLARLIQVLKHVWIFFVSIAVQRIRISRSLSSGGWSRVLWCNVADVVRSWFGSSGFCVASTLTSISDVDGSWQSSITSSHVSTGLWSTETSISDVDGSWQSSITSSHVSTWLWSTLTSISNVDGSWQSSITSSHVSTGLWSTETSANLFASRHATSH